MLDPIGQPTLPPMLDCAPAMKETTARRRGISDDSDELDSLFLPSPLVGEGGRRSLTDEGGEDLGWRHLLRSRADTPHPALTGHLLPQGEKDRRTTFRNRPRPPS
ncbi:hypothetical protein D3C80_1373930 [compost metagenome]